jgi:hypothetical protein
MLVSTHVHTLHKAGNEATEYEDAYDYGWSPDSGAQVFRCAVADGATEASFSALWATKLVRAYCRGELGAAPQLAESLQGLQQEWVAQTAVASPAQQWYVEEKLKHGAFSALVGLTLEGARASADGRADAGRWQALAVGDSCLFQVRGTRLVVRFPLARAAEFTNRPFLLSSNPAGNDALSDNTDTFIGDWQAGDRFYLMTDALAHWFLQKFESGERPWQTLAALDEARDEGAFAEFISAERASHALRNDDVTLLSVTTGRKD